MNILSLEGVTFSYKASERVILDGLSLDIEEGKAVMVSGPSGGGKTTLCLIATTIIPTRLPGELTGRTEIMGESTRKLGPVGASRYVGYVMQEPEYSMVMPTVEEEIAFGLENRSWPVEKIGGRVEELMEDMGIRSLSGRIPQRLSAGEKQAVAIAAAIAHKPRLLVLDEAFAGLDDEKRWYCGEQMRALKRQGTAILLIEHDCIGRFAHNWVDACFRLEGGTFTEDGR